MSELYSVDFGAAEGESAGLIAEQHQQQHQNVFEALQTQHNNNANSNPPVLTNTTNIHQNLGGGQEITTSIHQNLGGGQEFTTPDQSDFGTDPPDNQQMDVVSYGDAECEGDDWCEDDSLSMFVQEEQHDGTNLVITNLVVASDAAPVQPEHASVQPEYASVQPEHASVQPGYASVQPDAASVQPGHVPNEVVSVQHEHAISETVTPETVTPDPVTPSFNNSPAEPANFDTPAVGHLSGPIDTSSVHSVNFGTTEGDASGSRLIALEQKLVKQGEEFSQLQQALENKVLSMEIALRKDVEDVKRIQNEQFTMFNKVATREFDVLKKVVSQETNNITTLKKAVSEEVTHISADCQKHGVMMKRLEKLVHDEHQQITNFVNDLGNNLGLTEEGLARIKGKVINICGSTNRNMAKAVEAQKNLAGRVSKLESVLSYQVSMAGMYSGTQGAPVSMQNELAGSVPDVNFLMEGAHEAGTASSEQMNIRSFVAGDFEEVHTRGRTKEGGGHGKIPPIPSPGGSRRPSPGGINAVNTGIGQKKPKDDLVLVDLLQTMVKHMTNSNKDGKDTYRNVKVSVSRPSHKTKAPNAQQSDNARFTMLEEEELLRETYYLGDITKRWPEKEKMTDMMAAIKTDGSDVAKTSLNAVKSGNPLLVLEIGNEKPNSFKCFLGLYEIELKTAVDYTSTNVSSAVLDALAILKYSDTIKSIAVRTRDYLSRATALLHRCTEKTVLPDIKLILDGSPTFRQERTKLEGQRILYSNISAADMGSCSSLFDVYELVRRTAKGLAGQGTIPRGIDGERTEALADIKEPKARPPGAPYIRKPCVLTTHSASQHEEWEKSCRIVQNSDKNKLLKTTLCTACGTDHLSGQGLICPSKKAETSGWKNDSDAPCGHANQLFRVENWAPRRKGKGKGKGPKIDPVPV